VDTLEQGQDAIRRHAWREAYDLLNPLAITDALAPEDLEGLAEAAWWMGRLGDCIEARERAYALHLQKGNNARAALVALYLADDYASKLSHSLAAGWQKRAERLLENEPECIAHGHLARFHRAELVQRGDREAALNKARETFEIGSRLHDPDLMAFGLHDQGRVLLAVGRVTDGMALIDEATVAAVSGELSLFATGLVYCLTIACCQNMADYRRAADWTQAAERWCERRAIGGFPGLCRVHHAEMIRLRGSWGEAEQEARRACQELQAFGQLPWAGAAFYEVGEIRLRMGDLRGAEEAFRQGHELGHDPQPGFAVLHCQQGKLDVAMSMMRRALAPPSLNPLRRAKLLPAQVEIALAGGDLETARVGASELQRIAETYGTQALVAMASQATGMGSLAEGAATAAIDQLRRACELWQEVDAPYEGAKVRELLGKAYRLEGNVEESILEFQAALAVFERLGAIPDARKLAELLEAEGARGIVREVTRATKTFMFTDIVRSTNLVEAIGDDAWENLQRWHDHTLRTLFAAHRGEEVDHAGDGFCVAFETPAAAIECAISIQRKLAEHRNFHGFSPQVRIGLHLAESSRRGRIYTGKGVHQAARIGAQADGGEILASEEVMAAAKTRFPISAPRSVRLKGIAQPVRIVTVTWQ
jgi:class 3 adenylate cyclase